MSITSHTPLRSGLRSCAAALLVLLAGWSAGFAPVSQCPLHAADAPASLNQLATDLGYTADEVKRLRSGEVVTHGLKEGSDKELAAAVAMLVPAVTPDQVAKHVLADDVLKWDSTALAFVLIDDQGLTDEAAKKVMFPDQDVAELRGFLSAKPGSKFNLSSAELGKLAGLRKRVDADALKKDARLRQQINGVYRAMLADRLTAYQQQGVSGIATYDRGGDAASPAEELQGALARAGILQKLAPAFYSALVGYPKPADQRAQNRYYLVRQDIDGRPGMVLTHSTVWQDAGTALLARRQIYVGNTYNSMQILAGCVAVEGGTAVFYSNRTYTDQVAGALSGMKHKIGRGRMMDEVAADFASIRTRLTQAKP